MRKGKSEGKTLLFIPPKDPLSTNKNLCCLELKEEQPMASFYGISKFLPYIFLEDF